MRSGTVMDIPLDQEQPDESKSYLVQFDDSSTVRIPLSLMPSLLPKPPSNVDNTGSTDSLLPPFLQINQKITYEHQGQYWKGCLGKSEGRYCFVYKRHPYSKNEEWGSISTISPSPGLISFVMSFSNQATWLHLSSAAQHQIQPHSTQ